jgi:low temperature requirement protein LtrA
LKGNRRRVREVRGASHKTQAAHDSVWPASRHSPFGPGSVPRVVAGVRSSVVRRSRREGADDEYGADFLELFFDLVFVFAITQVSHLFLDHLSWAGAGQAALALLVVWWAWQYTTWVTNELDPASTAVRLLMFALMLAGLLLAIAIPDAFGDKALLFAGAYVAIQVGRHLFLTVVAAGPGTLERERAGRILIWFGASGVLWIAGALADGDARAALWVAALALDYGGPLVIFRVPGLRRLRGEDWVISTAHFTERFGLFVIIALGESIILTGATTAGLELTAPVVTAFVVAFLGTAALWWLYFTSVARLAEQFLETAPDRVLLARDTYTYGHALVVAGIIVTAVGDEIVIAHPTDELSTAELMTVVAGPVLYLLAQAWFRFRITRQPSPRRLGGALACVLAGFVGLTVDALVVGALLVSVLVGVAVADRIAGARRAHAHTA